VAAALQVGPLTRRQWMSDEQKQAVRQARRALKRAIARADSPEEKLGLFDIGKLLRSAHEVKEVRAAWKNLRATKQQDVDADPQGEQLTAEIPEEVAEY
jgi:hypothetical protein